MTSLSLSKPVTENLNKNSALKFIIFIGFVSLLADMTYEGARSITGPFLAILGANALVVGFVAGFGELLGYGLRFVSGYLADKTGQYWPITIVGYFVNLLAVPLLAFAGYWQIAAVLIIMERVGKAIRTPARDAMLSHAAGKMGMGWGFGLHEAMDKTGAMLGPLIVALVLFLQGSYRIAFAILLIPTIFALITLLFARLNYPNPHTLHAAPAHLSTKKFNNLYWAYLVGAGFIAAGYADFPLIAFHFEKAHILPTQTWIPIAYAVAMGISSITAPILGYLYDRKGFLILIIISLLSSLFAPFAFLGGFALAFVGVALWSIGVGAQESLMRAIVGNMIAPENRGSAYGLFNMFYGIAWFIGSVLLGFLYDASIMAMVIFSVAIQLIALPIFFFVWFRLMGEKV